MTSTTCADLGAALDLLAADAQTIQRLKDLIGRDAAPASAYDECERVELRADRTIRLIAETLLAKVGPNAAWLLAGELNAAVGKACRKQEKRAHAGVEER